MEQFIQAHAKIIRNILDYSQDEMAELIGVSRVHLSKIESGKVVVNRTIAIAFITIVILASRSLKDDVIRHSLISRYVEVFEDFKADLLK